MEKTYLHLEFVNKNGHNVFCKVLPKENCVLVRQFQYGTQTTLFFPLKFQWKNTFFLLQNFDSSVDKVELIILYLSFHQSTPADLSYLACYCMTICMSEP